MLSQSEISQSEPFDKGRIFLNYSFQRSFCCGENKLQFSQYGELSLGPLVTRTVGLCVRALACAGLPVALILEKPSGSCTTVSSLAVQFPVSSS